ncbi:MAG TPA: BON domain-containing protein [Candidatus Limnocylindria bacterium]
MERDTSGTLAIEPLEDQPEAAPPRVSEHDAEDVGTQDMRDEEAAEGADPYFAPTDPVLNDRGREVIGGFDQTSMDDVAVERSTIDDEPGDEALADAVRRELREDALTSHLHVAVEVKRGVAFIRGAADDLEDGDDAADVASRVPGVQRVVTDIETPKA